MTATRKYNPETVTVVFIRKDDDSFDKSMASRKKRAPDTPQRSNPNLRNFNFAHKFGRMGMRVNVEPVSPYHQAQIKTMPPKGEAVLLLAEELSEFERLNNITKDKKRIINTLILWNGSEATRPSPQRIPVVSYEKIENEKKTALEWHDLCLLAEHPPVPEKKPTILQKLMASLRP